MTFHQRIIKTFKRGEIDKIVWQPRIYYWFYGNGLVNKLPQGYSDTSTLDAIYRAIQPYHGRIPEKYKHKNLLEIYKDLNASPRYPQEVLGVDLFKLQFDEKIKCSSKDEQVERITMYQTPKGNLREITRHGYHTEYPIKTPDDIKVMEYILDHTEFQFNQEAFRIAEREFGEWGIVQSFYPRAPLQRLIIDYLGFENTIYALNDYPDKIKEFLKVIEECDDKMYKVLLDSPLELLNFGDNIDANVDSPKLFEEHLIPYYQKRINQIHQKGKFCHIHMDGSLKPLLSLINQAGFDGIEAATPLPQGDISLEELKDALGDTILLDVIPAILFLPEYSDKQLEEFATKVLDMFSPNLILGISDELPPTADIEKVRLVSKMVEDYQIK